jgi:hypothetical protein
MPSAVCFPLAPPYQGDAPSFQGAFFPGTVLAVPSVFGVSTTFPRLIGAFHDLTALLTPSWPRSERPISCRIPPSPGWSLGLLPLAARVRRHSRFPLGRGPSVRLPAFGYCRRSQVRWRSRLPHVRGRRAPTSVAVHPRWVAVHPSWAGRYGCYCSLPACSLFPGAAPPIQGTLRHFSDSGSYVGGHDPCSLFYLHDAALGYTVLVMRVGPGKGESLLVALAAADPFVFLGDPIVCMVCLRLLPLAFRGSPFPWWSLRLLPFAYRLLPLSREPLPLSEGRDSPLPVSSLRSLPSAFHLLPRSRVLLPLSRGSLRYGARLSRSRGGS